MGFKSDIEIAQECTMEPITKIAEKAGIDDKYLEQYGKYKAKIDYNLLKESDKKDGKLILVTAINPTPAGEGKTTTTVGLADGMQRLGKEKLEVKVENLKNDSVAAMMMLSEESRRMQDMMKMYNMYGMDPSMFGGQETLVLNANHPLVQFLGKNQESEHAAVICEQLYDLAMISHKQLSPDEMTKFVQRSNDILMMIAK